ncbi:MAG: response regulator transcription factor [Anaerolineae bacterium]
MSYRILMIEDDRDMVTLGKLILEREGYEVLAATDGEAGLDILFEPSKPVDLVLLDIMMLGMDGWQVLEKIRGSEEYSHLPVIMLTARHYLEDEAETASYAEMFDGYITKPFVVRELLSTISNLLTGEDSSHNEHKPDFQGESLSSDEQ